MHIRILDTNVLLDRPINEIIVSLEPCKIVIPLAVVNELDRFKGLEDARGHCARQAIRFLDSLRPHLHQGVSLPSGHQILVEVNHCNVPLPEYLPKEKVDTRILAIAKGFKEEQHYPVTLITQDICQRVIADTLGVSAENYAAEQVNLDLLYRGWDTINVSYEEVQDFYQLRHIATNKDLLENQFICMEDSLGGRHLGRYRKGFIHPLRRELHAFGLGPAEGNLEQSFLMDALLDPNIELVSILGPAGTGKTLLALAAGLQQVVNQRLYSKLIVTRALIPHSRDIGALPGTKKEKLTPWMAAIYDNLEFLTQNFVSSKHEERCSTAERVERFMEEGFIELEALTYIRGRSIPKQWILIDEAQNLTKENIKTIITRAGMGSKIVLTGDIQQIDNYRLTATSNGFVTLIDAFKNQDLYAHISLSRTERSRLAALGVDLLP
ncbi:PhoH family protein [Desulforamulus reducens MI-1]|uniref:PhoH family protein n=1 Tax=Desulforamulus reducens (strain ATCC BAA-1160 / DSM 100696 / MI-1) TaxID=349161 RepID=A4J3Y1_DESRM|nr:PhoH family protein [Desulforamulus reducens]ABO49784.1 PhoH family protein [Desulforamulus reducens MI-1]